MKGQILLKALELLKDAALDQIDFMEAILRAGYGASMGKVDYEHAKIQRESENEKQRKCESEKRRKRLRNFVYQMRHDGLIEELSDKKLRITRKGERKVRQLKTKLPGRHYPVQDSSNLIIISFDIPEKLRTRRDWFREAIRNLGFIMIHQSLWVGKKKIPKGLIDNLDVLEILEYIEILEVTKSGTLKKLKN